MVQKAAKNSQKGAKNTGPSSKPKTQNSQANPNGNTCQKPKPKGGNQYASKDPLYAKRMVYRDKIKHQLLGNISAGCGTCKSTCAAQKSPPIRPSGFIFSINEPNVFKQPHCLGSRARVIRTSMMSALLRCCLNLIART